MYRQVPALVHFACPAAATQHASWLHPSRSQLPVADETEAFNGRTIPQFPEKGEDVNLAGVRMSMRV